MNDNHNTDRTPLEIDDRTKSFIDPQEMQLFGRYAAIIRRLRAPDGCPWDRKQTLHSLRRFVIEESFELLAAIDDVERDNSTDAATIADELGDVFLVSLLVADALHNEFHIPLEEVLKKNGEKLVRRHPHVFGDVVADDSDTVVANWRRIKAEVEHKRPDPTQTTAGLPPLERALEIQKTAAQRGFDWPDYRPVIGKIYEEIDELRAAISQAKAESETETTTQELSFRDNTSIESEIGDVLFSAINLARKLKIDPSVALAGTNNKFLRRFAAAENLLNQEGLQMEDCDLAKLEKIWCTVKKSEARS